MKVRNASADDRGVHPLGASCLSQRPSEARRDLSNRGALRTGQLTKRPHMTPGDDHQMTEVRTRIEHLDRRRMKTDDRLVFPEKTAGYRNLAKKLSANQTVTGHGCADLSLYADVFADEPEGASAQYQSAQHDES